MIRAKWEHWKNPRTKKWDGHSYKNGYVLHASRQGYNNEADCLDAIEATSGSRESKRIEFKFRHVSRKAN